MSERNPLQLFLSGVQTIDDSPIFYTTLRKAPGQLVTGVGRAWEWHPNEICNGESAVHIKGLPAHRLSLEAGKGFIRVAVSFPDAKEDRCWVQPLDEQLALLWLSESLNGYYENSSGVRIRNALRGAIVAARFYEDGSWYRAAILDRLNGSKYKVHFVDFGNSAEVEGSELRVLGSDWLDTPPMGIPLRLPGVQTQLLGRLAQDEPLFASTTANSRQGLVGQLWVGAGPERIEITEWLNGRRPQAQAPPPRHDAHGPPNGFHNPQPPPRPSQHNGFAAPPPQRAPVPKPRDYVWTSQRRHDGPPTHGYAAQRSYQGAAVSSGGSGFGGGFGTAGNLFPQNGQPRGDGFTKTTARPAPGTGPAGDTQSQSSGASSATFGDAPGSAFTKIVDKPKPQHTEGTGFGVPSGGRPKAPSIPDIPTPWKVGDARKVTLSFFANHNRLYFQDNEWLESLEKITDACAEVKETDPSLTTKGEAEVGLACLGMFEEGWYRAVIRTLGTDGQATVDFVDYGNTESIPISELKTLVGQPAVLTETHRLCVACKINGTAELKPATPALDRMYEEIESAGEVSQLSAEVVTISANFASVRVIAAGSDAADILRRCIDTDPEDPKSRDATPTPTTGGAATEEAATGETTTVDAATESVEERKEVARSLPAAPDLSGRRLVPCQLMSVGLGWGDQAFVPDEWADALHPRIMELSVDGSPVPFTDPAIGDVCLAEWGDEHNESCWYRAEVRSICADKGTAEVFFLDYGNCQIAQLGELRAISKAELAAIHPTAVRVRLSASLDGIPHVTEAAETELDLLSSLDDIKLNFAQRRDDGTYEVELFSGPSSTAFVEELRSAWLGKHPEYASGASSGAVSRAEASASVVAGLAADVEHQLAEEARQKTWAAELQRAVEAEVDD